jgi:hypothetical protein
MFGNGSVYRDGAVHLADNLSSPAAAVAVSEAATTTTATAAARAESLASPHLPPLPLPPSSALGELVELLAMVARKYDTLA